MGMSIEESITRYKNNAEYERTHGNLQGCLEFQQLAGWLKDYKRLLEQEPQSFKWCTDCKEYDQEKHCCHRWSKVIRDTVEEMKQEQEPKWIPVSERLPKNRGFYLVSTTDCITIMEFINGWISQNIGLCNGYVKAWMPLPQPYKAESEAADGKRDNM